jgi:hypothetical protein
MEDRNYKVSRKMFYIYIYIYLLGGLSPQENYTDRATAACQLLRIEGATRSAWQIPTVVFSDF